MISCSYCDIHYSANTILSLKLTDLKSSSILKKILPRALIPKKNKKKTTFMRTHTKQDRRIITEYLTVEPIL